MENNNFPTSLFLNKGLASYSWGEGELVFGKGVSQDKARMIAFLFDSSGGLSKADSKQEVKEIISFIHEFRHLQQDFILGVGAWDFCYRNTELQRILIFAKQAGNDFDIVKRSLESFNPRKVRPIVHGSERDEIITLRRELESLSIPVELAGLFTTRRLLELDAVLYTDKIISQLKWSPSAISHLEEAEEFFSVTKMPSEYSETLLFILGDFHCFLDNGIPGADGVKTMFQIINVLVFLALNHPDPQTLKRNNLKETDCLPGIRLIRYLTAMKNSWNNIVGINDKFEKLLSAETGYNYPTLNETSIGWVVAVNGQF